MFGALPNPQSTSTDIGYWRKRRKENSLLNDKVQK
jgi:hypothetical protein